MNENRRSFLKSSMGAVALVGISVFGGSIISSCGGEKAPDCNDLSALTADEKKLRENYKYVINSKEAGKQCSNCQLYNAPATEKDCGGCQLFKGPVAKEGYCISWALKQA